MDEPSTATRSRSWGKPRRLLRRGKLTSTYFCRVFDPVTKADTWKSTGAKTREAAHEWWKARQAEEAQSPEKRKSAETVAVGFETAYKTWIEEKAAKCSPGYVNVRRLQCERYWIPFFSGRRLQEITPATIREYIRRRKVGTLPLPRDGKTKGRKIHAVSARTANDDIVLLREFFGFCVANQWLVTSPVVGIDRFSGQMRKRIRSLTQEQEENLLAACEPAEIVVRARRNKGGRSGGKVSKRKTEYRQKARTPPYLRAVVEVALYCGLRRRTLMSVRWRDCDLEARRWHIPAEYLKVPETYEAPIPLRVVEALKKYRRDVAEYCQRKRIPPTQRLGPEAPIFGLNARSSVRKAFATAAKRAGIPELTLHDLRRCYVNKLRQAGVPLEVAMKLSAHRDVGTMVRHYREVQAKELEAAVDLVDGLDAGGAKSPTVKDKRRGQA